MSKEEGVALIANIASTNGLKVVQIFDKKVTDLIVGYEIQHDGMVNVGDRRMQRAWYELGVGKLMELASVIMAHPRLGSECLKAMAQGQKVLFKMKGNRLLN